MKLLLASDSPPAINNFNLITDKQNSQLKVAWIITAMKRASNADYVNDSVHAFFEQGIEPTLYDIEGKTYADFGTELSEFDLLFVEGGQPCFLLKTMQDTGFDKFILEWIKTKPYASTSAGSYIMCPTLEMAFWHKPNRDRYGLTSLQALGAVDFLMSVHYTDKKGELLKDGIKTSKYQTRILRDGQSLLVEDQQVTFVGEDEVKI